MDIGFRLEQPLAGGRGGWHPSTVSQLLAIVAL